MFEVILIIVSFILAWGEAWFLDCRVIPQERHAQHYFKCKFNSNAYSKIFSTPILLFRSAMTSNDRTPLVQPSILIENERPPQSVTDFYSPLDTAHHSDEEDEEVRYS